MSLPMHIRLQVCLGLRTLEAQKTMSLILKQCMTKKIHNFKNTVNTVSKVRKAHFLSSLICLHCTRGLLCHMEAGSSSSTARISPLPTPTFLSLPISPSYPLSLRRLSLWEAGRAFHFRRKSLEQLFKMQATAHTFKR